MDSYIVYCSSLVQFVLKKFYFHPCFRRYLTQTDNTGKSCVGNERSRPHPRPIHLRHQHELAASKEEEEENGAPAALRRGADELVTGGVHRDAARRVTRAAVPDHGPRLRHKTEVKLD